MKKNLLQRIWMLISVLILTTQVWAAEEVVIASWSGASRTANQTYSPTSSQSDNSSATLMSECGLTTAGSGASSGSYYGSWTNDKCIYVTGLDLSNYTSISLSVNLRRRNGTSTANFYVSTDGSTYATTTTASKTLSNTSTDYSGISITSTVKAIKIKISGGSGNLWLGTLSIKGTQTGGSSPEGPVDPTATFDDGEYTIGGSALDLSTLWESNSSGAVTYTVSNANGTGASISGTSFTATTAGTCTVQAKQAAVDGSYNAITKTATITVNPARDCNEVKFSITSNTKITTTGDTPTGSTATYSKNQNGGNSNPNQQFVAKNYATLTLSGYAGKQIKSITLSMKSNSSAGAGTFSAVAGSTTLASIESATAFNQAAWNGAWSTSYTDVSIDMKDDSYNIGSGEDVVITLTSTQNSLYCESITICWKNGEVVDPKASLGNGTYCIGDAALDLSTLWSSNSSGAVTYTVSNANGTGASISGTSFTATTAGTCTVQASQAAVSGSYNAIIKTATVTVVGKHTVSLSPAAPANGTTSLESAGTTSVTICEGVSVNLRAIPNDCYSVGSIVITPEDGYSEIEQTGNDYEILGITKNLTVAVTYAQRTQYTVTLDPGTGSVAGSTTITQSNCGDITLPAATSGCESTDTPWTFAGWSRTKVTTETTTAPVLIAAGSFTPTADETLYAVYSLTESSGGEATWEKVYNESSLALGDSVIIAADGYDYAISTDQKTKNRAATAITKSEDKNTLTAVSASVQRFFLTSGTTSGTYAFYDPAYSGGAGTGGYLCSASSSQNYLKTQTSTGDAASWTISINSIDGVATIKAGGTWTHNWMRYNSNGSSTLFACYSEGQKDICLYVRKTASTSKYHSLPTCVPCVEAEASLSSSSVTMTNGATTTVTLTSLNTAAVTATSDNTDVVTVSVSGKTLTLTSSAEGEATITIEQVRDSEDEGGHCAVYLELPVVVTTPTIEIIEWEREAVTIEYDGDMDASVVLGKEVEHGSKTGSVATELFFSKYFEAAGEDKLFAIFNGTGETVDLTGYTVMVDGLNVSAALDLSAYGKTTGQIADREELVFYRYGTTGYSRTCMAELDGYSDWYECLWDGMRFSGRHSIGLYKNGALIDVVGGTDEDGDLLVLNKVEKGGISPSWGDESGFNAEDCGDNIQTTDIETNYGLSTNRCLLVRKNTVTSGSTAVATNKALYADDDATKAAAFKTMCTEWGGLHIPGTTADDKKANTCIGMGYVAGFDYSDYYVTMETFSDETTIGSYSNGDGTYTIPMPHLDTLACRLIRIQLEKSGNIIASSDPKVPIIVDSNMSTNDAEFSKHSLDTCKVCDVVIRDGATLTKAANAAANDRPELQDIYIYSGGHLVVPSSGTNFKANSIIIRSQEDEVSTASFAGGITLKSKGKKALHYKRVKPNNDYWICLPHACQVGSITWVDGSTATLGKDYNLYYYDGAQRAATQAAGCWKPFTGSTLQAGVGYVLSVGERVGHTYRELVFPMDTISEKVNKEVVVDDFGAGEDITPNHKGWNLVGNPYMTYYQRSKINAGGLNSNLTVGVLKPVDVVIDELTTLHTYELDAEGAKAVPYITVPVSHGTNYKQVAVMDYDLPPFICYFVQIGDDTPQSEQLHVDFKYTDLTDAPANTLPASYAPRRITEETIDPLLPVWVTLRLTNDKSEFDETTLVISDRFTDEYEIGGDLGKWASSDPATGYKAHSMPLLYTKADIGNLAFQALPDASAEKQIPVSYYGYSTQPMTFSLRRDNRDYSQVASVMLYDKNTGTYTDLLSDDYTFYPAKKGLFQRFFISVRLNRPAPAVPTGTENLSGTIRVKSEGNQLVVEGLPKQAKLWIFDTTGKLIVSETVGNYRRTYTMPAAGVYNVRVEATEGNTTLRAVVKG